MGAWGVGHFDNDDAADWFYELEEEGVPAAVALFDAFRDEEAYLDASQCCRALAAAEVLAALRGRPARDLPEYVEDWLDEEAKDAAPVAPEQIAAARAVVERIGERSELRELWEEAEEDFPVWQARVADLLARLG